MLARLALQIFSTKLPQNLFHVLISLFTTRKTVVVDVLYCSKYLLSMVIRFSSSMESTVKAATSEVILKKIFS